MAGSRANSKATEMKVAPDLFERNIAAWESIPSSSWSIYLATRRFYSRQMGLLKAYPTLESLSGTFFLLQKEYKLPDIQLLQRISNVFALHRLDNYSQRINGLIARLQRPAVTKTTVKMSQAVAIPQKVYSWSAVISSGKLQTDPTLNALPAAQDAVFAAQQHYNNIIIASKEEKEVVTAYDNAVRQKLATFHTHLNMFRAMNEFKNSQQVKRSFINLILFPGTKELFGKDTDMQNAVMMVFKNALNLRWIDVSNEIYNSLLLPYINNFVKELKEIPFEKRTYSQDASVYLQIINQLEVCSYASLVTTITTLQEEEHVFPNDDVLRMLVKVLNGLQLGVLASEVETLVPKPVVAFTANGGAAAAVMPRAIQASSSPDAKVVAGATSTAMIFAENEISVGKMNGCSPIAKTIVNIHSASGAFSIFQPLITRSQSDQNRPPIPTEPAEDASRSPSLA